MLDLSRSIVSVAAILLLSVPGAQAESGSPVETGALETIALYPERSAPASVISLNQASVSARLESTVTAMSVRVGDQVAKGATLVALDCDDFELALEASQAQLQALQSRIELATKRLKRTESLRNKQSISEEALDERVTDLSVLKADRRAQQANLKKAKLDVARCLVKSPYNALIMERHVSVGDYTRPGQALVSLIDLEELEVSAQVFASDARRIDKAEALRFEQDGQSFPVTLRSVSPAIDSLTRNQEVRLLFADARALPGAAGKLLWRDPRPHVPASLIVKRDGQLGVYTVNDHKAHFVSLPDAQAGRASPLSLPLSTVLVVKGQFALSDGQVVSTGRGE